MTITERILIADRNAELLSQIAARLNEYGYINVDTALSSESLKRTLERNFYNVIVCERELMDFDEITAMYEKSPDADKRAYSSEVILISENAVDDTVFDVGNKSVYTLKKPVDCGFLHRIITSQLEHQRFKVANARLFGREAIIERSVTAVMHGLGIPAHIKGYQFLRTAITHTINDPDMINYVTKSLYPTVAKIHGTTPSRVERAIRHAIEVAWDRGDVDTLTSYFGYTISRQRGKPTNSEFIAMIADNLRIKNSDLLDTSMDKIKTVSQG